LFFFFRHFRYHPYPPYTYNLSILMRVLWSYSATTSWWQHRRRLRAPFADTRVRPGRHLAARLRADLQERSLRPGIGSVLRWLHFVGPHPIQRMDCEIVCKQISSHLYIYSRTCTNQKITYTRLCHVCDMHYPGWSWQGLYAGAAKIVSEKLWTFLNGDHWANARFSYRRNQKNVY